MKKIIILIVLMSVSLASYTQLSYKILETVSEDSLDYYINQVIIHFRNHPEYHADSCMQAGLIVYQRNRMIYSRKFFEMSRDKQKSVNDLQGMARSVSNLAVLNEYAGKYDLALKNYFEALEIFLSLSDSLSEIEVMINCSTIYSNIGVLYNEIKDYKNAGIYIKKAIEIDTKIIDILENNPDLKNNESQLSGSKIGLANNYNNLAYMYSHQLNINVDSALICYSKSYKIFKDEKSPTQYQAEIGIAGALIDKKQYTEAIKMLENIHKKIKAEKNEILLWSLYSHLSVAYTETGQYTKALENINLGLKYTQNNNIFSEEIQMTELLYKYYLAKKEYKKANEIIEKVMILKDSLLNKEKNEAIASLRIEHETENIQHEANIANEKLQLKELELEQVRSLYIIIALSVLLVIIIIAVIVWRAGHRQKLKQVLLETKLLRSQINPHFLFNALGAIQAYMIDHQSEETMGYLMNFSSLMRNILDSSRSETIELDKEIEIIKDYLILQQLRLDNKFEYNIIINEHIDTQEYTLPPMLLQPFVENAVVHGVKPLPLDIKGKIDIIFELNNKTLIIKVIDNGKGKVKNKKNNKKHVSHATNITSERLKAINKLHKFKISMDINYADNGTTVELRIKS